MRRRLLTPILVLLLLLTAVPVAAQAPVASPVPAPAWRIGETSPLDIDSRYPALSPDGTMLAGADGDGRFCVWDVETLTSDCVDEELPIRDETVMWSPDGTAVAFALDAVRLAYESDIYVYELATGKLANLTDDGVEGGLLDTFDTDPPADDVPVWSPDSRELAFVRSFMGDDAPGSTTIMRIDRAGGEPTELVRVTQQPWAIWMPMTWLPDGTLLYAHSTSELDDARNGIWQVSLDGGAPVQIAPGAEGSDIPIATIAGVDPRRGQVIVFSLALARQYDAAGDQPRFWLVDIAAGERVPFPALPAVDGAAAVPLEATYAPDGGSILIVALAGEGVVLYTMNPETLAVAPVEGEPLDVAMLPDASLRWAGGDTVVLHASGGSVMVTLEGAGGAGMAPPEAATPAASGAGWRIAEERELAIDTRSVTMSPDGQWLAGLGPEAAFCIWDVETLTPDCVAERLPIRDETIAWSPDGTAVAFALDAIVRLDESDIYVYELATGELTNLTDDGVEGGYFDAIDAGVPIDDVPAWSPDSQRIAFVRSYPGGEPGATSIMVIDRTGGEPMELLPLDIDEPFAVWMPMTWLPDGTLLYSQVVPDIENPYSGVWKIAVDDGASPLQIAPGSAEADIPGPWISGVVGDRAIVHSYWLMGRFEVDPARPMFWTVDIATGERTPLAVPGGDGWIVGAGVSPDGATALLVTSSPAEGPRRLMVLDIASGTISPLDAAPRDTPFVAGSPQWATNGAVLLLTASQPLLLTLAPAS